MPRLSSGRLSTLLSCHVTPQLTGLVLFIHEVVQQVYRCPTLLEQAASAACCANGLDTVHTRLPVCPWSCQP